MMSKMKNIKFIPNVFVALSHFILFIVVFILFLGRTKPNLQSNALIKFFPNFYQHISNFSISYILFSSIGFAWLILGISTRYIFALGMAILMSNFVYELWIPVLNTPDIIDAYYGFAGTMLSFVFLLITKKYGLKVNNPASNV